MTPMLSLIHILGPAFGADQLLPGGHGQGGRKIMPVGAAVAGKAGIHQPQAVQPVSYTHLDVYKRQTISRSRYFIKNLPGISLL